jgi:hypothetical protein
MKERVMSTEMKRRELIEDRLRKQFEASVEEKIDAIIEREREEWEVRRAEELEEKLWDEFEDNLDELVEAKLANEEDDAA